MFWKSIFVVAFVSMLADSTPDLWLYGDGRHDDTAAIEQVLQGNRCVRWAYTMEPVLVRGVADLKGRTMRVSRSVRATAIPRFAVVNGHLSPYFPMVLDVSLPLISPAACPWATT